MSDSMTVAFAGLGTMGEGMVRNLLGAGHAVRGWNRTRSRAEALAPDGMTVSDTPQEAATGADVAIACVADDAALREVALGSAGLLAGLDGGAVLMDCGTTSLALTRQAASACADHGVGFVDAPITGSLLGAARGQLTFMAGGPVETMARLGPLFDAMGKHTVHVGSEVGAGQSAKLALNMAQAVVLEGILEGYTLARSLGVPLAKMSEIFDNSAGKTGVGSFKTPYLQQADYTAHFKLGLMQKDLHLALDEASRRRVPLPLAQAVRVLYDQGVAEGMGEDDFLVLAKLLERWSGTPLRD